MSRARMDGKLNDEVIDGRCLAALWVKGRRVNGHGTSVVLLLDGGLEHVRAEARVIRGVHAHGVAVLALVGIGHHGVVLGGLDPVDHAEAGCVRGARGDGIPVRERAAGDSYALNSKQRRGRAPCQLNEAITYRDAAHDINRIIKRAAPDRDMSALYGEVAGAEYARRAASRHRKRSDAFDDELVAVRRQPIAASSIRRQAVLALEREVERALINLYDATRDRGDTHAVEGDMRGGGFVGVDNDSAVDSLNRRIHGDRHRLFALDDKGAASEHVVLFRDAAGHDKVAGFVRRDLPGVALGRCLLGVPHHGIACLRDNAVDGADLPARVPCEAAAGDGDACLSLGMGAVAQSVFIITVCLGLDEAARDLDIRASLIYTAADAGAARGSRRSDGAARDSDVRAGPAIISADAGTAILLARVGDERARALFLAVYRERAARRNLDAAVHREPSAIGKDEVDGARDRDALVNLNRPLRDVSGHTVAPLPVVLRNFRRIRRSHLAIDVEVGDLVSKRDLRRYAKRDRTRYEKRQPPR